ncbi:hypothetical protein DL96DRAFT_1708288 [Flagelloscypha sp. PMI_526]|nr:hypothetical protein DL96DRAFT_1708288 [Flagelloscypha sp. PMI_526]
MPKAKARPAPSHEIGEYKYFSIWCPYPAIPNGKLVGDHVDLARWISCIIPSDALITLYHKPLVSHLPRPSFSFDLLQARSTAIIEVAKDLLTEEAERKLLGEHKWSLILKKPDNIQAGMSSKIFYSAYNHGREVQKDGWRTLEVEEHWFELKDGTPFQPSNNGLIHYPYPLSTWCDLPPGGEGPKQLYRILPAKYFPQAASKFLTISDSAKLKAKNKKAKKQKVNPEFGLLSTLKPSSPKATDQFSTSSFSPVLTSGSLSSTASVGSTISSPPPGLAPPGLPLPPGLKPPPGLSLPPVESTFSKTSSFNWADDVDNEFHAHELSPTSISSSYAEDQGWNVPKVASVTSSISQEWDDQTDDWGTVSAAGDNSEQWPEPAEPKSLWGKNPEDECPEHGPLCTKGVCKIRDQMEKVKERERRRNEDTDWDRNAWRSGRRGGLSGQGDKSSKKGPPRRGSSPSTPKAAKAAPPQRRKRNNINNKWASSEDEADEKPTPATVEPVEKFGREDDGDQETGW